MNQMPQMPSFPSPTTQAAGSADTSPVSDLSPSFAEDSGASASGSAEVEKEKPYIIDPSKSGNQAEVRSHRRGIQVVAVEKGFYNQLRLAPGDEFTIRSEEDFGTWFECVDPILEKKRVLAMKNKKVRM